MLTSRFEGNLLAPLRTFLADALRVSPLHRATARQLKTTRSLLTIDDDVHQVATKQDVSEARDEIVKSLTAKVEQQHFSGMGDRVEGLRQCIWS